MFIDQICKKQKKTTVFFRMLENGIGLSASEISILGEPIEFYEQLISNIENAKNNIILSSLYIGNGDKEARLYNAIEDFLSRGGKALIILDFNRGQRGKISSKTILQSIQTKYPSSLTLKVSIFYLRLFKKTVGKNTFSSSNPN